MSKTFPLLPRNKWGQVFYHEMIPGYDELESVDRIRQSKRILLRERFQLETLPYLFVENSLYNGTQARKFVRTWNRDYEWLKEICQLCDIPPFWNGKPLTLQIDHENGIDRDHRLTNLRFLCPNCHTQTDTFTSKNIGKTGRYLSADFHSDARPRKRSIYLDEPWTGAASPRNAGMPSR